MIGWWGVSEESHGGLPHIKSIGGHRSTYPYHIGLGGLTNKQVTGIYERFVAKRYLMGFHKFKEAALHMVRHTPLSLSPVSLPSLAQPLPSSHQPHPPNQTKTD